MGNSAGSCLDSNTLCGYHPSSCSWLLTSGPFDGYTSLHDAVVTHSLWQVWGGRFCVLSLNEFLGLRWATLADKYLFTPLTRNHHLSGPMAFYPWRLGKVNRI